METLSKYVEEVRSAGGAQVVFDFLMPGIISSKKEQKLVAAPMPYYRANTLLRRTLQSEFMGAARLSAHESKSYTLH